MLKVKFTKMVASGNDFVLIERTDLREALNLAVLAKEICNRKYGVGADGLLLLEKSKTQDVKMRIFNSDGSEAAMCGNGARCAALYTSLKLRDKKELKIETKAGIIEVSVIKVSAPARLRLASPGLQGEALQHSSSVKIKLTDPTGYREGVPVLINGREIHVDSLDTGVPHAVVFVEGIDNIDVSTIGREIRYYQSFASAGTNADFVEIIDEHNIRVRTYERGVEDETLACGTGSAASAIATAYKLRLSGKSYRINVKTQGKEVLKVYFDKKGNIVDNVWLEGKVKELYRGCFNFAR